MSARYRDHGGHPAARDDAGDMRAPQPCRPRLAAVPAGPPLSPTDAQVAALIRTLARIIRRQCTVPARPEQGQWP
jgi:hypothetical protein